MDLQAAYANKTWFSRATRFVCSFCMFVAAFVVLASLIVPVGSQPLAAGSPTLTQPQAR